MTEQHLWEVDHDYYCNESNTVRHGSWSEFVEGMGKSDLDMNLLFRWDWSVHKDDDEKPIHHPDPYYRDATLQTFWVMQRKGYLACHEVSVCRNDEPEVRKWLASRFTHLAKLWLPLSPADVQDESDVSTQKGGG